jgi:hypothetical protein
VIANLAGIIERANGTIQTQAEGFSTLTKKMSTGAKVIISQREKIALLEEKFFSIWYLKNGARRKTGSGYKTGRGSGVCEEGIETGSRGDGRAKAILHYWHADSKNRVGEGKIASIQSRTIPGIHHRSEERLLMEGKRWQMPLSLEINRRRYG